jgi:hypothetical protein
MKEYRQAFRVEDDILYVRLSGEFPKDLLKRHENLFQPLIEACLSQKCEKSLIDARELEIDFNTVAMFQAGVDASFLSRIGLRVALVAREDMIDPFFDDVAKNRGAVIGVFTDMISARNWLDGHRGKKRQTGP